MKTKKTEWWDEEQDFYKGKYGNIYADEDSYDFDYDTEQSSKTASVASKYTYKPYFYKKSFDFSISLETRVKQLIKTISGKDLKLAKANGWGSDEQYFYYNADDLVDTSDDEVLGLIFHQLARELFVEAPKLTALQNLEKPYKHLLDALEDNRVDRPMVEKYNGADYYLRNVWHTLRKDGSKPKTLTDPQYDNYGNIVFAEQKPIPAMEFIYNISVLAHGEQDFVGKTNFLKAIPAIENYLNAPSFEEALKYYPEIKKHYPAPDRNQQQRMDNQMGGSSLTDRQRESAQYQAEQAEQRKNGEDIEARLLGQRAGQGQPLDKNNRDYTQYQVTANKNQGIINTLHKLLNSIMVDNDTKRYIGRQKRGKIDGKALHKLVTQNSNRIFKKELERQAKKYAFTILVDQSGSMSGKNMSNAFAGTVILSEVFTKLRIPFQVVGFDDMPRIYKNFFSVTHKDIIGGVYEADGGGTQDLVALRAIYELNNKVPNTYKKSVFVLTDGDGSYEETNTLVQEMSTKAGIDVFGLAIGSVSEDSMKKTYPKYVLCPEVEDLPSSLVNLVREQFRRS